MLILSSHKFLRSQYDIVDASKLKVHSLVSSDRTFIPSRRDRQWYQGKEDT